MSAWSSLEHAMCHRAARELNSLQHAVKAFVGTARCGPNPIESLQFLVCPGLQKARGGDPDSFDREIELRGGVLQ